jgi:hypothetical protein
VENGRNASRVARQNLSKAIAALDAKTTALEKVEIEPDKSQEQIAALQEILENFVSERVEVALTLQAYVEEAIQKMDDLAVAKIKSIQADADNDLVRAEAGLALQGYNDALEEYARIEDELVKARSKAQELMKAARTYLDELGMSEHEQEHLMTVFPPKNTDTGIHECRHGRGIRSTTRGRRTVIQIKSTSKCSRCLGSLREMAPRNQNHGGEDGK